MFGMKDETDVERPHIGGVGIVAVEEVQEVPRDAALGVGVGGCQARR